MPEKERRLTAAQETVGNILKEIDLYWDWVTTFFLGTFGYIKETEENGEPILKSVTAKRKFNPDYEISILKSIVVVPGETPLSYPKSLTEIFISPDDAEKGIMRVKETKFPGDIKEYETPVISLPLVHSKLYEELLTVEVEMLTLLVDAGMDFDPEDKYIDEVKKLAYKILGSDAEELWS